MKRLLFILIALAIIGCSSIHTDPTRNYADLTWTAPGDSKPDGSLVPVVEYDLRWDKDSLEFIISWNTTTKVNGVTSPKLPGVKESFHVINLPTEEKIYFCIKSRDSAGNWSLPSNIPYKIISDERLPGTVLDLDAK